jgi:murein DD-endopeptidase MepM/ murein hydrolase activator NlpD
MASLADVFVAVKPDLKEFGPAVKREIPKHFDGRRVGVGMSKSLGSGFRVGIGGVARTMFAPIAAAAAAVGGFSLFKGFIEDAAESAKISRLTAQVIKSTGGAANVSAEQVNKLATAISNKTGVDDEAIQSGANLLLTFKNVRNEVGKGNDIFNQANQIVTDMSVALGQDTKSSAIQLGKALNDPIKGVTALQRVGVSFTASQKEQIKTLVESGDVMGAQKLILKELGDEFGGAAEAAASPMDKLKVIVGNLGEQIGGYLLPFIEDAATWLGKNLPQALEATSGFIGREVMPRLREFGDFFRAEILPRLKEFGGFIKDEIVPQLISFGGWLRDNAGLVKGLAVAVGALVAVTKVHGAVLAVQAAGGLVAYIKNIKIVQAATKTWAAVQWLLNAALTANPIGIVIALVAGLVAGIVIAWQKSEKFRDIVIGVWQAVQDKVGAVVGWIKTTWNTFWEGLKSVAREGLRRVIDSFLGFVDKMLQGAEQAFGWVPELGDKLDAAHDEFAKFRRKVNNELGAINDEAIKINVKTYGNLEFGGAGGRGGAGISMGVGGAGPLPGVTSHASQAMGGALDIKTLGLDASRISDLATDFVGQTKAAVQKQITKAFEAGTMGPAGFPLPRGRYRVGRGTVGHGYPAVDFPAAMGTPIYAVRSGVVTRARRLATSYGIHAILGHPGGWGSLYAHMSRMFVRSGQFVRAGQQLGRVGSTGNSTGPHLHFEARRNGRRVNPRSLISYDKGGMLPTGISLVHNGTGQPEPVRPADMPIRIHPADILAIGQEMGRVVLSGMGAVQRGSAQTAGLYSRSG